MMSMVMAMVAIGAKETAFALVLIALVFAAGVAFGRGWKEERRARRMGKRRYGESVGQSVTFSEALARRGIGVGRTADPRIEGSRRLSELIEKSKAEKGEKPNVEAEAKKPEPPKEEPWSWL